MLTGLGPEPSSPPTAGSPAPRSPYRPDLARAHGSWVYLAVSTGAGALIGTRHGVEAPLLAGTAFAGAYLVASAAVSGWARKKRPTLVGVLVACLAPLAALGLGAPREFLWVFAPALVAGALTVPLAQRRGVLAPGVVALGVLTLGLCAPAAVLAGGAGLARAAAAFALLGLFFTWRSLRMAAWLRGAERWDPELLRGLGLREAAYAAVWGIAVSLVLRGW